MTASKRFCCVVYSATFGAVLIIVGGIIMVVFDVIYKEVVAKQTSVIPGTLMYNINWKEVKTPVYRSFYFFNITNPDEFLSQKPGTYVKPILKEIGPYTYREYLVKDEINYLDVHPEEVHFRQTASFYFDSDRSVGREEDMITTINFLVPLLAGFLEHLFEPGPLLNGAYLALNQLIKTTETDLLFTKSVGDYLWGFQDPLLTKILDLVAPDRESDEFGLFLLTNMSVGWQDYQVYTGRGNYQLTNIITKFNNMSELPYWFGESCNKINGTDGTFTQPFMEKEAPVYFYVDEMCRSLYAVYEEETTVHGIKGWKFHVPGEVFYSSVNNEHNKCFCEVINHELCQHDGALLLSPCLLNTPLVVSFPHFLYSDGYYLNKLEGVQPDKVKHEMTLTFEPTTGLVINASSRIQLNLFMYPHPEVKLLQTIDESFIFPMVWLNENSLMEEEDAEWVSVLLYKIDDLFLLIQIILLVIGSVLFIVPMYVITKSRCMRHCASCVISKEDCSKQTVESRL